MYLDCDRNNTCEEISNGGLLPKTVEWMAVDGVEYLVLITLSEFSASTNIRDNFEREIVGNLKVIEPKVIKRYLKLNRFLELVKCAGHCSESIGSIHLTSPKANIRYCDTNKKGFDAPEDDPSKESMECSLVLCMPCYGVREAKYGTVNNRGSRRRG